MVKKYLLQNILKISTNSHFFSECPFPIQGLFTHASFFSKFGLFDTNYRYCMDYDHLLRAYKEFPRVLTKDIITAIWRADGIGNDKALEIFKEYDKTKRNNKILNNIILLFINYWILFKHSVKVFFVKPKC